MDDPTPQSLFVESPEQRWVSARVGESLTGLSPRRIQQLATDGVVRIKAHPQNPRWHVYHQGDLLAQRGARRPDDVEDVARQRRRPTKRTPVIFVDPGRQHDDSVRELRVRVERLETAFAQLLATSSANYQSPF